MAAREDRFCLAPTPALPRLRKGGVSGVAWTHRSNVMRKRNAHALGDLLQLADSPRRQRYAVGSALVVRAIAALARNQDLGVRMRRRQRLDGRYQLVDAGAKKLRIRERADVDCRDD